MGAANKKISYIVVLIVAVTYSCLAFLVIRKDYVPAYKISKPIAIEAIHDKVISGLDITGNKADCIKLTGCYNITIKNCRLQSSKLNGIQILNCRNIKVTNCYFENDATGVYAYKSTNVSITHNQFKNMLGPVPKGQMVQFNEVYGAGNAVSFNKCQNDPGAGNPEDAINMYKTNGTAASPVQINGNYIRGGGPGKTGGGIMLGDSGGAYIVAKNNILVNPGQYGMAIAGGHNLSIINNKIFARQQAFTNVGIYIWDQSTVGCALNTISGNQVNFTNAQGEPNHSWDNGNCGEVKGWGTNNWGATIDAKILPANIITR